MQSLHSQARFSNALIVNNVGIIPGGSISQNFVARSHFPANTISIFSYCTQRNSNFCAWRFLSYGVDSFLHILTLKHRQRFNVYKSYFRSYARKHNEGTLERGKLIPQANFFSHFFETNHRGKFDVTIKIIDGAENVFSLRRKEVFWQYRLGTFLPRGLNERAADVELNMFACGIA